MYSKEAGQTLKKKDFMILRMFISLLPLNIFFSLPPWICWFLYPEKPLYFIVFYLLSYDQTHNQLSTTQLDNWLWI